MVFSQSILLNKKRSRKTLRLIGCLASVMMLIFNVFVSSFIHVADAAAGQTITPDKPVFIQGETITLSYTGAGANGKDWVGLYKGGSGSYFTWKYIQPGDGKVSFTGLAPDNYDAVYFVNDGYTSVARTSFQVVPRVPVTGVTLDQPKVRMYPGETTTLTAAVMPANANDTRVSWTSSDPTVVSVNSIGGSASLTGNLPGKATVTATTYDGSFTSVANVTVDPIGYIRVAGIAVDKPAVTLGKGQTTQLNATIKPTNASNPNVVWTSSNPSVATVTASVYAGTVTAGVYAGTVTAGVYGATVQAISGGTVTITATSADDPGYFVTSTITVNVPVTGVSLDQTSMQLLANQSAQLHAILSPADALNKNVTWSSSDPNIVQVTGISGTTDANVVGLKVGTAKVTVRTIDGNFTADCTVKVTQSISNQELLHLKFDDNLTDSSLYNTKVLVNGPAPVYVPGKFGKALQLSASSVTGATYLDLGNSDQFFKFGRYTDFTFAFWTKIPTTDNVATSIISNMDSSLAANNGWNISVAGNVIRAQYAPSGYPGLVMNMDGVVDNSWHHVIVSYKRDGMATFYRDGVPVSSYDISSIMGDVDTPFTPKIGVDGKGQFLGKSNVILDEMRMFRKAVTADEAMTLYKEGQVFVSGVTVDKSVVALNKGESTQLNATLTPANPDNPNVTWKSSNPFVASVAGGLVTAVSGGTTKITVTTADGGFQAVANVTVNGPSNPVAGVKLDSPTLEMRQSQKANLHAVLSPAMATNQNLIWSSSDPTIVGVTGVPEGTDAVVEGLNPGVTIVTVRTEDGNFTDTCIVTVDDSAGNKPNMIKMSFENNMLDIARNVNAAVYGTPAFVPGRIGNALLLDATGTYLDLIKPQLGDASDFALSFWINSAATTDNRVLVSNKDVSNPVGTGWSVGLENGGIHWNYKTSGSAPLDYIVANVADGNWHHIAISHDRAYDKYADFYKDGVLIASVDLSNNVGTIDSGFSTKLGADGTGHLWGNAKVQIDELQLYNRTLKASEVAQQFSVPSNPDNPAAPVITLKGDNPMIVGLGSAFTDPGATAMDEQDGDITSLIKVTGSVNTSLAGTYTLLYDVTNSKGSKAATVTRSVYVKDMNVTVPDTQAPIWPVTSTLTASNIGKHGATLNWTAAIDNVGVTAYKLYTVTGSTYSEVITLGNVLTYNVKDLNPGSSYTFTVKAGDAAGNWSNYGPSVTIQTLRNSSDDSNNHPPASGNAGGAPSTPEPIKTGKEKDKVTLNLTTDAKVTNEKTSDGRSVTKVTVDADKLTKAFSTSDQTRLVIIEIKGSDPVNKVELPVNALLDAAAKKPGAIVQIKVDGASYSLPVHVSKNLPKDQVVTVTITKVSGNSDDALNAAIRKEGAQKLANPVDFNVSVNGKDITDFNGAYVERTLTLPSEVDPGKVTAVWFDGNNRISCIPSVISNVNGSAEVTIHSPHNSIYTVIQSDKSFADMQGHWARADVEMLANKLIVNGETDRTFAPDNRITRAEFAALLVRSLGLVEVNSEKPFADVNSEDWFAGSVGAAQKAMLIAGFEDGTFKPNANITREQMVSMIVRALKVGGKEVQADTQALDKFTDRNGIADWAKDAVAGSLAANIVQGITDTTFAAKENATRAQGASMLKRMLQYSQFIN
ncbi:Ig-like domain-containing protein [Paenibacillus filicis]|uniref:Ig-like domain-containing protein n=1 Tax=Paenibacillus gyeongsangnamensis TaxID=3388067 RepID=A0ABT4QI93_9BACL|nr:Ig-like domain-containing protein [Paenibacillus filicis]MCZ8516584.1 Ig-like domain-containing protein [Paenibacillus filicis]